MATLVLVSHILIALAIIGLILLQQGKGAAAGASFGGGASQTVFGSEGGGGFLTKATAVLAFLFFVTSFSLAIFAKNRADVDDASIPEVITVPADASEIPVVIDPADDDFIPVVPDED